MSKHAKLFVLVHISRNTDCSLSQNMKLKSKHGLLSSAYAASECPYVIEAKPGQRINVTVRDFHANTSAVTYTGSHVHPKGGNICQQLIYIEDGSSRTPTSICRQFNRSQVSYTSESSSVRLWMKALDSVYMVEHRGMMLFFVNTDFKEMNT